MNVIGEEINEIAHAFNAGYGNKDMLRRAVELMSEAVRHAGGVLKAKEQLAARKRG